MKLAARAVHGVQWSSLSQGARQAIQFLSSIILARLLSPADFGLMGMSLVVVGLATLFKDFGTAAAVVQQKELTQTLLSSLFWINITVGLLITILLFFLSPLVGILFHEPRVIPLVRFLSFTFFVSSLGVLQQSLFERNLDFKKLAKIEIVSALGGALIGIISALSGLGVKSLIYQTLAMSVLTTVGLWICNTWRPSMVFCWKEIKLVSPYSLNLTGFNLFNYFIRNGDNFLIGRFLGAQNLGYYSLAYRIMCYPLQIFYSVIGRVMFPLFSQIQSEDVRFRNAYLKMVSYVSFVTFPVMLLLTVLAKPFVLVLFGSQWSSTILLIMILAPVGLIQSVGTTVGVIYQAKGRADWMFRWGVAIGIIVMIAFVIGLRWGIIGVAIAYVIVSCLSAYHNFAIPFRLIHLKVADFLKVISRPLSASLTMVAMLMVIKHFLPEPISGHWILILLTAIGGSIYLCLSWIFNREKMVGIWEIFKGVRGKGMEI